MARALTSGIVAVIACAISTSACNGADRHLQGRYRYVGTAEKATLELHKDGTYKFCTSIAPCEAGKYDVESSSKPSDRIYFDGNAMRKFTAGGWANVVYNGGYCPCIQFQDPDSGAQFEKVAGGPGV